MKLLEQVEDNSRANECAADPEQLLELMLARPTAGAEAPPVFGGIVIGELIAITGDGATSLVVFPGQPGTTGIAARSVLDLHGAHVGRQVVLAFEEADPARPIVMGVLSDAGRSALAERPGQVEVDADGERMIVSAKEQLVLRCGKASITLTKAGKVLIHGAYISSRSTGVNRIRGGSIHLN